RAAGLEGPGHPRLPVEARPGRVARPADARGPARARPAAHGPGARRADRVRDRPRRDAAGDRPALRGGGAGRGHPPPPPGARPQPPPGVPAGAGGPRALGRALLGGMSARVRVQTVVVGAGLSGLVAGLASARRGDETVVLEASDRPGGVVRTERAGGYLLEL